MAWSLEQMVQRHLSFAIVDEVDSILIDEARTPLIISGQGPRRHRAVRAIREAAAATGEGRRLHGRSKSHAVPITEKGVAKVEKMLGCRISTTSGNLELTHQPTPR